jgi:tRNA(Arg) A34 adenosine deaminase TadA
MNERYFKFAREAAKESTYHGSHNFSPAIGAVCVYKGSIVASACNSNKTSPLQAKYNVYRYSGNNTLPKAHAETILLQRLRWKFGDSIQWDKVHIYLYREYADGTLAPSRPCPSCMAMLREYGITKISYTTEDGYATEHLK